MIKELVHLIRSRYRSDATIVLEMDAGFFDQMYFKLCDDLNAGFVASGKMHPGVKKHVGQTGTPWTSSGVLPSPYLAAIPTSIAANAVDTECGPGFCGHRATEPSKTGLRLSISQNGFNYLFRCARRRRQLCQSLKDPLVSGNVGTPDISEWRSATPRPEVPQFRIQIFQPCDVLQGRGTTEHMTCRDRGCRAKEFQGIRFVSRQQPHLCLSC